MQSSTRAAVVVFLALLPLLFTAPPAESLLIDNGDGTVTDSDTSLMWLKDANSAGSFLTWDDAVASAEALVFGGYDDWRLPSALNSDDSGPCVGFDCIDSELGHLYYTELGNAALGPLTNTGPFINVQSAFYWTSTEGGLGAFEFGFLDGSQFTQLKSANNPFWAVREIDVAAVPEPPTALLLGLASGLLMILPSRRGQTFGVNQRS